MWKLLLALVALVLPGTAALESGGSAGQQPIDRVSVNDETRCKVSHVMRYDMARKRNPVFFSTSPLDDLEQPSIEPMNSTAGEQWEFDGVSEDGMQAFVFGFYRDPNFSFFGAGNLRVYAEFAFANGSRYAIVDYAEESTIESCRHTGTRGIWKTDDWAYMFEISADMSQTKITVTNPEAEITFAYGTSLLLDRACPCGRSGRRCHDPRRGVVMVGNGRA
ncbi:hypothetical protein F5144DRAFT_621558 [Chaetomium tenue]|uniref:Uncharacterized protein n=1 Tax=Chaetomium tenue TaxID=1854479 RepID=A0ACB7P0V2_9PEZI|nr:hypothetical protein F5144DRAFT_621558 [Chaetomium globosum]